MTLSSYILTSVLCIMTWTTVQIHHHFLGGAHLDLPMKEPTVSAHCPSLSVCHWLPGHLLHTKKQPWPVIRGDQHTGALVPWDL